MGRIRTELGYEGPLPDPTCVRVLLMPTDPAEENRPLEIPPGEFVDRPMTIENDRDPDPLGVKHQRWICNLLKAYARERDRPISVRFVSWDRALHDISVTYRNQYDVIQVPSTWTAFFVRQGILAPLTDGDESEFPSRLLPTCRVDSDGPLYAVPWQVDVRMMYVRWPGKPDECRLQTFPELSRWLCDSKRSLGVGVGSEWEVVKTLGYFLGGRILKRAPGGRWTPAFGDKAASNGLEQLLKLARSGRVVFVERGGHHKLSSALADALASGRCDAAFGGPNMRKFFQPNEGIVAIPQPRVTGRSLRGSFLGGSHLGVAAGSRFASEAMDLVQYLVENDEALLDGTGSLPGRLSSMAEFARREPEWEQFRDAVDQGVPPPSIPQWATLVDRRDVVEDFHLILDSIREGATRAQVLAQLSSAAGRLDDALAAQAGLSDVRELNAGIDLVLSILRSLPEKVAAGLLHALPEIVPTSAPKGLGVHVDEFRDPPDSIRCTATWADAAGNTQSGVRKLGAPAGAWLMAAMRHRKLFPSHRLWVEPLTALPSRADGNDPCSAGACRRAIGRAQERFAERLIDMVGSRPSGLGPTGGLVLYPPSRGQSQYVLALGSTPHRGVTLTSPYLEAREIAELWQVSRDANDAWEHLMPALAADPGSPVVWRALAAVVHNDVGRRSGCADVGNINSLHVKEVPDTWLLFRDNLPEPDHGRTPTMLEELLSSALRYLCSTSVAWSLARQKASIAGRPAQTCGAEFGLWSLILVAAHCLLSGQVPEPCPGPAADEVSGLASQVLDEVRDCGMDVESSDEPWLPLVLSASCLLLASSNAPSCSRPPSWAKMIRRGITPAWLGWVLDHPRADCPPLEDPLYLAAMVASPYWDKGGRWPRNMEKAIEGTSWFGRALNEAASALARKAYRQQGQAQTHPHQAQQRIKRLVGQQRPAARRVLLETVLKGLQTHQFPWLARNSGELSAAILDRTPI